MRMTYANRRAAEYRAQMHSATNRVAAACRRNADGAPADLAAELLAAADSGSLPAMERAMVGLSIRGIKWK